ncbi:MAG: rhodanese-like domain-containing protein [Comamonadaceae bacterium]|nr:rhodanese-like domain-containing protein [Comamonadaceae bacterium]
MDADWLSGRLRDPKVVVLEVRYHPHRHYTVGHIPGAVQVQRFKDLGANFEVPIMRLPSREAFQATLRGWGVSDDSTIVVYDDSVTALASRLVFLLDYFGFDMSRVKILNGGTVEWQAFNEPGQGRDPAQAGVGDAQARQTGLHGGMDRRLSRRPVAPRLEGRPARCPPAGHVHRRP